MSIVTKDRVELRDPLLAEVSDEALLLRYHRTADRTAFEELVQRYHRELFSYLRRYLGDAAMAEDVFQTTFLRMHLKCGQFEEDRKFRPWLYAIATNQAIDYQRRNRRHRMVSLDRRHSSDDEQDAGSLANLLESTEQAAGSNMEFGERRQWVRQVVDQLPIQLKSVVTLIYFQGLKYRDAAEALGVPVGTVKSRMHAAIAKLNDAWMQSGAHDRS